MSKKGLKPQRCFCCGRILEPVETQWAAGPVCYPCFWAAKFVYESGYQEFADIPKPFADMISEFFVRGGYLWPDDLIQAFKDRPFAKANVGFRRWWSPKEENDQMPVSLNKTGDIPKTPGEQILFEFLKEI